MVKRIPRSDDSSNNEKQGTCGIVMPISAIDSCPESHWEEVKKILTDAIQTAGYEANLVSDADDVGVIQKRIVQNLYDNDIVVCDVSCKNANVMFELGLRLAFDKPTIIVSDDKTGYSFDTAPIEHLTYPRDLSYFKIVEFKTKLKEKILGTMNKAKADASYSPFLKSFGEFKVASIEHSEGTINEVVLQRLDDMQQTLNRLSRPVRTPAVVRRLQEIEDEKKDRINTIVRNYIDKYTFENNISESDLYKNTNDERDGLQAYMEQDIELCALCGSEDRLIKAINDNLLPF